MDAQAFPGRGYIMIVDDNPANLKLLEDMLLQQGHEVRSFPLGRLALAAVYRSPPDLILLDVNMPEIDGYEVCKRLKAADGVSEIPVIFLSALNDTEDKVKAFRTGAADYISKPFQLEEVQARVETHLKLHYLQEALKLQNGTLEQAVASRTRELFEANQRLTLLDRSKTEFLNLISHELRTPLNGLLGVSELILEEMASTEENIDLKRLFGGCRGRILSILDDALLLTQIDLGKEQFRLNSASSLSAALSRAIGGATGFAISRGVALTWPQDDLGLVVGDDALLVRALHALCVSAIKFSSTGGTVRLSCDTLPQTRRVIIESAGQAIPDAALSKFFDVFAISEVDTPAGDLGLGPAVASRILALFGASVSVGNLDPLGIRIAISLKDAS